MKTIIDISKETTNEKQLVIRRTFDAPRERVWKAWTDPEQLKRWFGPRNYTVPVCTVDLRVGGRFHLAMRGPDNKDYWVLGIYREIAAPERLVYSDYFSDKDGNIVSPVEYGLSADFPKESLITVAFDEQGGKTKMTLLGPSPRSKERDEAEAGWNESFDKLVESLR